FRAKGPNVHRQIDLDQRPRGPIGNKDDPYFDPNEDPSYNFKFETRTYSKNENADSRGDVKGSYTYVDDVGERHDVQYIAGRDTGFHVSSSHPDSPNTIGSPFISAGPDQRRTESSDSKGNVRGSYTFLDDKGVQRTVNYIAGPGIGYRIVKNSNDPHIPAYFPTIPSAYDPEFVNAGGAYSPRPGVAPSDPGADDVFKGPDGTAASGHVKPPPYSADDNSESNPSAPNPSPVSSGAEPVDTSETGYPPSYPQGGSQDVGYEDEDASAFGAKPTKGPGKPARPTSKPYRPLKKPYVPLKPFQTRSRDDYYDSGRNNNPQFAVGFNINTNMSRTAVIRNIGEDYFSVPPGVSVRAHVQSIDLYPFGSKPISPSEALEHDKT
ncbi:Cuticular protein RR-1 motif 47, partial [Operophtera brumata]